MPEMRNEHSVRDIGGTETEQHGEKHLLNSRFVHGLAQLGCAVAVVCIVILLFFRTDIFTRAGTRLINILMPFIYGFVIAYLLRPCCVFIEKCLVKLEKAISPSRRKEKKAVQTAAEGAAAGNAAAYENHPVIRMIAILLSLVFLVLVIVVLLLAVIPETINSITRLVSSLPGVIAALEEKIETFDQGTLSHEIVTTLEQATETLSGKLQSFLESTALPYLQSKAFEITSSFFGLVDIIKNIGLGCIIASYLLGGWEKFRAQGKLTIFGLLPKRVAEFVYHELKYTNDMFSSFISGKLVDSLILGIICFVGCSILKTPYAMLVSVVVGVTNLIPFFGQFLGAIPSFLLILTVSPQKSIVFIIFLIILQQVDGNLIGPMILGDKMGLSGFWILFAILFFGSLGGLPGMLAGVPVFAVCYDLFRRIVISGLRKQMKPELLEDYQIRFSEKDSLLDVEEKH